MPSPTQDATRLRELLDGIDARGVGRLTDEELTDLPRLYRRASTLLARSAARQGRDEAALRALVSRAHGVLYREAKESGGNLVARAVRFFFVESPRAIRAEWRLLSTMFAVFYGIAIVAFFAVIGDIERAFVLFDSNAVSTEIAQLRETEAGEPFRGNFTFGFGESPQVAGWILAHNIGVSILFFGAALVPPVFLLLLVNNALMLGTYTGVAWHWDQAGAISSILWCHGVIELQMIVLAGAAGLVLVRAWVAPGPWSRAHAMRLESRRAWALLAPVFPLLFLSGLIEGFISPHAPLPVRLATAVGTGIGLIAWVALGGRTRAGEPAPVR